MWIEANAVFQPEDYTAPIIGIASKLAKHDSGLHKHQRGQLLFSGKGCIKLIAQQKLCVLPPRRLVWIPPQTTHQAIMHNVVDYRSIYLDCAKFTQLPSKLQIFQCNPLLDALLERIAFLPFDTPWLTGIYPHLSALLIHEILQAPTETTQLKLPSDRRLQSISWQQLPLPLQEIATQIGASEKTITRLFSKETGLTYQQWRQQWRLLKAIELLSQDFALLDIALQLGFSNDSVLVNFFKQMTGQTPRHYMRHY